MQLFISLPQLIPFYFCVLSILHMKKLPKINTSHPQFLYFNIPVCLATATTTILLINIDVFRKLLRCIDLYLLNLEFQAKHLELLIEDGDALIHKIAIFLLLLPPDLLISFSFLIFLLFLSPPALLLLFSPPALFSFFLGVLLLLFFPPDLILFLFPPELDLQLFLIFPFLPFLLLYLEDYLVVIEHLLFMQF